MAPLIVCPSTSNEPLKLRFPDTFLLRWVIFPLKLSARRASEALNLNFRF
ncbi:MAG: hypothetical protein ACRDMA_17430 [Solirubrobacterales bacterium]